MNKAKKISKEYADRNTCYANDPNLQYRATMEAVEYGYNRAIEKACEWLKNNAGDYAFVDTDRIGNVANIDLSLVQDFRKYMEGE